MGSWKLLNVTLFPGPNSVTLSGSHCTVYAYPTLSIESFLPQKADDSGGDYEAISLGYENVLFPFAWVAIGLLVAIVVIMGEFCSKSLNGGGGNSYNRKYNRKSN